MATRRKVVNKSKTPGKSSEADSAPQSLQDSVQTLIVQQTQVQPQDMVVSGNCNVDVQQIISIPISRMKRTCKEALLKGQGLLRTAKNRFESAQAVFISCLEAVVVAEASKNAQPIVDLLSARGCTVKLGCSVSRTARDEVYGETNRKCTALVSLTAVHPAFATHYSNNREIGYSVAVSCDSAAVLDAFLRMQAEEVEVKRLQDVQLAWQQKQATIPDVEDELRCNATAHMVSKLPMGAAILDNVQSNFDAKYMSDMPSF